MIRDEPERWRTEGSVPGFAGSVVAVRTDRVVMPGGDATDREVVDHPGSVGIVALDARDRVLLIRQYRHPVGRRLWEIPAGLRDVAGEPLWRTASRELAEEAGLRATTWATLLDVFVSPGITNERSRIFLAQGVSEIPDGELDFERIHEEADMTAEWIALDAAVAHVLGGDIHNSLAVMGILATSAARATGFRDLRAAEAAEE